MRIKIIRLKGESIKETPLMKQYLQMKREHPDAILLFRVGDFYETFSEDAIKTAKILGITLTKRANGAASHIELAGFPYHSLQVYLPKLIASGARVAICEQLEDPKLTKTIVKRGVTELLTPGTILDETVLKQESNNYLACVYQEKGLNAVSLLELSTGEFLVTEGNATHIHKILSSYQPGEILFAKGQQDVFKEYLDSTHHYGLDDYLFEYSYCLDKIERNYQVSSLKGFGIEETEVLSVITSGVILHYLSDNKFPQLTHIHPLKKIESDRYIWLDSFTIRNLELIEPIRAEGKSLFEVINFTKTPMGSRLLKKWILMPLKQIPLIEERLGYVAVFHKYEELRLCLREIISKMGDLERLISRISLQKTNPRELLGLLNALKIINELKTALVKQDNQLLIRFTDKLNDCKDLARKIYKTLKEDAPSNISKGNLIKSGVHEELDEYRNLSGSGKEYLVNLQRKEIEETGISSLKIGFNNVFGYYLEVTHAHKEKVPSHWIRKQTLTGAERYVTPEIKEYEEKILKAEERIQELEKHIFEELVSSCLPYISLIQENATVVSELDCYLSFAEAAERNQYIQPKLNEGYDIEIKAGRHPVIEKSLPIGDDYIHNDLLLDDAKQQIIIITGPNMSGKSAILRQTALICLMAQMGSFVPARIANIGLIDKVFTRVGASDNLSQGESTFMVEMIEAANILNNITPRSLVILDEIGRGTSTYDGISIAWAITEYLHNHPYKPKTLFATHYHELNEIQQTLVRVKNYHVSVKETGKGIVFLRKLVEGGSEHSFGIHVAQIAGIPSTIVKRANELLKTLEADRNELNDIVKKNLTQTPYQLQMFEMKDTGVDVIKKEINSIDLNTITPLEAMMKLHNIKNLLKKFS